MNAGAQSAHAFIENNGRGKPNFSSFRADYRPPGSNPEKMRFRPGRRASSQKPQRLGRVAAGNLHLA